MLYSEYKVASLTNVNSMKRIHLLQLAQLAKMLKSMDETREFLLKSVED